MPDDANLLGRQAALAVVSKIKKTKAPQNINIESLNLEDGSFKLSNLEGIIEAINSIESKEVDLSGVETAIRLLADSKSPLDLSAVIDAISQISVNQSVDIETDILSKKLDDIRLAIEGNTAAINDLVKVAKTPRTVAYDAFGRVTEIKLKD